MVQLILFIMRHLSLPMCNRSQVLQDESQCIVKGFWWQYTCTGSSALLKRNLNPSCTSVPTCPGRLAKHVMCDVKSHTLPDHNRGTPLVLIHKHSILWSCNCRYISQVYTFELRSSPICRHPTCCSQPSIDWLHNRRLIDVAFITSQEIVY